MSGGFGLCGIPEALIEGIERSGTAVCVVRWHPIGHQ
jgi:acyl CoA:acetate/3-ketoacid CoA transferase alpha subunit